MAQNSLLNEREEATALRHMKNQPASAEKLKALLDKVTVRAAQAASKDDKVTKRLEGRRSRVLGTDLAAPGEDQKADEPDETKRHGIRSARVGIYDYDRDVLVLATVDLRDASVAHVAELKGVQPPITPEELEEAKQLVLSDPAFQHLKRRTAMETTAFPSRTASVPTHPAQGHRTFDLFFWTGGKQPKRVGEAIVDLSAGRVYPWTEERPEGAA